MPLPAIDATVGGPTANSYVTQAEAADYFAVRFGSDAWNNASTDANGKQVQAILAAAKNLSKLKYRGVRLNPNQPMQFPRYLPNQWNGEEVLLNTLNAIPQAVMDAQCEEALWLLIKDAGESITKMDSREEAQKRGVKSFQNGSIQEVYADGSIYVDGAPVGHEARNLLAPYIRMTAERSLRTSGFVVNSFLYGSNEGYY